MDHEVIFGMALTKFLRGRQDSDIVFSIADLYRQPLSLITLKHDYEVKHLPFYLLEKHLHVILIQKNIFKFYFELNFGSLISVKR